MVDSNESQGFSDDVHRRLEQVEQEQEIARYRTLTPFWSFLFTCSIIFIVVLATNQIFNTGFFLDDISAGLKAIGLIDQEWNKFIIIDTRYYYILLAALGPMIFILFPTYASQDRSKVPFYDVILGVGVVALMLYFVFMAQKILDEAWEYDAPEDTQIICLIAWAYAIEIGRRTGGWSIFFVTSIASSYLLWADASWLPNALSGATFTLLESAALLILSEEGLLGIPMRAFAYLVFGFLIFGVALQFTGAGAFFINFAFALLGHVRGGPAKVAIFASGLMGSMSGSVVTNVLTTGTLSIPAMKRVGFKPAYAGGVEACASTGGTLMPPIMGATAFIMAEFLNLPYIEIALAAAVPSILYYFGLFMQIDANAQKHDMKGIPREELPKVLDTIKEGWYYIFSFALLVYMLVALHREQEAPFYATVVLLVINQVFSKKHRWDLAKLKQFVLSMGLLLAELGGLLASIGLVIGALSFTGMAGGFTNELVHIAGSNTLVLLMMGALTSFILGIGLTVTAAYMFLAIILAPALVETGMNPMAVHLFMLYWAMISFITPPVAIGAFAASKLSGSPPMQTGVEAMKIGVVIYFVPFFFVYNPALIGQGPMGEVIISFVMAIIGIVFIASAIQGAIMYLGDLGNGAVGLLGRAILFFGGICIAAPDGFAGFQLAELTLVGVVCAGAGLALGKLGSKKPSLA